MMLGFMRSCVLNVQECKAPWGIEDLCLARLSATAFDADEA